MSVNILYVDIISSTELGFNATDITIVVNRFPWTDRDRITWFLTHEAEFRAQHSNFKSQANSITIMVASNGFINQREYPHEDLYCFSKIKNQKRCIEKEIPLRIRYLNSGTLVFESSGGDYLYHDNKIENAPDYSLLDRYKRKWYETKVPRSGSPF